MERNCKLIAVVALLVIGISVGMPAVAADVYVRLFETQKKIAESGDASAQLHLGEMYELGLGTTSNTDEALKWYAKAANQGNPHAAQRLEALRRSMEEERREAEQVRQDAEQATVVPDPAPATVPPAAIPAQTAPKPAPTTARDVAVQARREAKARADEQRRRALVREILARQQKNARDPFE